MGDYITDQTYLVFPNGNRFQTYMDPDISATEKATALDLIIEEAEAWVNDMLQGKTAVPALHAVQDCKRIALEYARFLILRDNYIFEKNDREPVSGMYKDNAEAMLDNLRYPASASVPVASADNVGNGTMSAVTVYDEHTRHESWIVRAYNDHDFEVIGSLSGALIDYNINDGKYPVQADGDRTYRRERRLSFTITEGTTPFEQYDEFTFDTFQASFKHEPAYTIRLTR
jgi:hypothetical protein